MTPCVSWPLGGTTRGRRRPTTFQLSELVIIEIRPCLPRVNVVAYVIAYIMDRTHERVRVGGSTSTISGWRLIEWVALKRYC